MKYLADNQNLFFSNFRDVVKQMGGDNALLSSEFYNYWINNYTPDIQNKINLNLKKFILSGEYKLKSPSW